MKKIEYLRYVIIIIAFLSISTITASADWLYENGETYYLKDNGEKVNGWININDNTYYFNKDGKMKNKNSIIDNIRYTFTSDGVCTGKYTGWTLTDMGRRYYLNGQTISGWKIINNKKYYFDNLGVAYSGQHVIDGLVYTFSEKGVWDNKEPKKFKIKKSNYYFLEYGQIMYDGKIYKTYDEVENIKTSSMKFIGTVLNTLDGKLSEDFDASFYPKGTLLYLRNDGDIIAVNNNSFFTDKKITILSTDYNKAKTNIENINKFPENDNVNHRLCYNNHLYDSGTYVKLDLLTIEGIKGLKLLGTVKKIAENPSKNFESSYFPIGSKIYRYDDNTLIIVYYDWVGTEHAAMTKIAV